MAAGGAAIFGSMAGCGSRGKTAATGAGPTAKGDYSNEEYVWVSANSSQPMFLAHDMVALKQIGEELGVKTTVAGPNTVDIPGLVATIEQTAARRPTGMMVVGWDPSALVPAINKAIDAGIPVVCVDADVPASKRMSYIGTDWFNLGVEQGNAMLKALKGRKGKVALQGLIEQYIDQRAFAGMKSVIEKAGLIALPPQQDKANQAESARVATDLIQAHPDLVGIAGFDSESGPGIGLAIKELKKEGKIVATCVDAEPQHLQLVKEGYIVATVMQKRELFTYYGVKALFDIVHSPLKLSADDKKAGIVPVPVVYSTGTVTITAENVDLFLKKA